MDTVNISVPDTEKVINYSPNYYKRLNLLLSRYTKRFVCVQYPIVFLCGGGNVLHAMKTAARPFTGYYSSSPHRDLQNYLVWRFAMNMVVGLSRAYRDTRKAFRKVHCQGADTEHACRSTQEPTNREFIGGLSV